ncbi:MAG TPA: Gfo/Idh/MocA family oxidoreductase [Roseiflexaceae bacterium]|nr:Gfo/Idh/MocA family oxidoreductase [Roseiflexaceae bacterium]
MQRDHKLRVLQVGCGGRARAHIAAMLACGAVDLLALCDLDEDRLNAAGEQFGIARRYRDMAEAIRAEQPDLVDIVTPPTIRASIVEPAIEAGARALLIEKPLALTPSESRRLVELGSDRLIAVNTQYQWMPHWQRFWGLLAERALGEIRLLRASTRCNVLEQGPHIIDLALTAAARAGLPEPEWVLAACDGLERFGQTPVPADTSATIGLGAARLHLNAGPSAPEVPGESVIWYQQQVEVIGDAGRLWVSLNQGWKLWRDGAFESGPTGWPQNDGEAQSALFVHLRDALLGRGGGWREFPTRIEVAARNADLLFGCYASALRGSRVALGEAWSDAIVSNLEQRY